MVGWIRVFHLIGLVFWLGSLLVVTHVLALHTEESSAEARKTLGRLQMKLLKGLAHPGAALMLITGIILVSQDPYYLRTVWLRAKLILVVILIILDLRVYFRTKAFHAGKVKMRGNECMALHGAIDVAFFCILILVLIKPFGLQVRRVFFSSLTPVRLQRVFLPTFRRAVVRYLTSGQTVAAWANPPYPMTRHQMRRRKTWQKSQ